MDNVVIMQKLSYILLFFAHFIFLNFVSKPVVSYNDSNYKNLNHFFDTPKSIFMKLEEGLSFGEAEKFSGCLSSQTYLSLSNGITGYYSPNQAFYVLQDYFNIYKPVNFRFLSMNDNSDNPYASGYYKFESKGVRGTAQVYVSLKLIGNNWKISQITIN